MEKNMSLTLSREVTIAEKDEIMSKLCDVHRRTGIIVLLIPDTEMCTELLNIANLRMHKAKFERQKNSLERQLQTAKDVAKDKVENREGKMDCVRRDYNEGLYFYSLGKWLETKIHLTRRLKTMIQEIEITGAVNDRTIYEMLYKLSHKNEFSDGEISFLNECKDLGSLIYRLKYYEFCVDCCKGDRRDRFAEVKNLMATHSCIKIYAEIRLALDEINYLLGRCDGIDVECTKLVDYLAKKSNLMKYESFCTLREIWLEALQELIKNEKVVITGTGRLIIEDK